VGDRYRAAERAVARRSGVATRRGSGSHGRERGRERRDETRDRRRPRKRRGASPREVHERRRQPRHHRGSLRSRRLGELNLLFLADVVGVAGRRAVEEQLPALRERYDADLAIVNGENVADGVGITPKLADKLLAAGADVVTLGNHTYRRGGI